jgi:hypothetical protein
VGAWKTRIDDIQARLAQAQRKVDFVQQKYHLLSLSSPCRQAEKGPSEDTPKRQSLDGDINLQDSAAENQPQSCCQTANETSEPDGDGDGDGDWDVDVDSILSQAGGHNTVVEV